MKYLMITVAALNITSFQVLGRGCCSHHGGQAYCSNGRWVCGDGTYSPSCTCSYYKTTTTKRKTTTTTTTKKTTKTYYLLDDSSTNNNSNNSNIEENDTGDNDNSSVYIILAGLTGLGSYVLKKYKK